MARSHIRGWEVKWTGKQWVYIDNENPINFGRPCKKCGRMPTKEGYDACLGYIPGAVNACCGHGAIKPFIIY